PHHPHLFRPLQPRPAPGDPGADRQHGGQHWTPIWGQLSAPIDSQLLGLTRLIGREVLSEF
ncbi:hypothetical protein FS774_14100, partial [Agrobacterium vitis]|nr:hypothetical protein [Agrobacterium vitis]